MTVSVGRDTHGNVDKLLLLLTEEFHVQNFPTSSTGAQELFAHTVAGEILHLLSLRYSPLLLATWRRACTHVLQRAK